MPHLPLNFVIPTKICDSPQTSSFAEVTQWSMALESIRTRNQKVIHAVEKSFSDPRNWRAHQINEVREKS
jgi:hypothetical protein